MRRTVARSLSSRVTGPAASGFPPSVAYPAGSPAWCDVAEVQSHHGRLTATAGSPRARRNASVSARSKKYRYARCQSRNRTVPCWQYAGSGSPCSPA